jgi:hypothetical protein
VQWNDEPMTFEQSGSEFGTVSAEGADCVDLQSKAISSDADQAYYENFLHEFFLSIGMPDLAWNYQPYPQAQTAGAQESSDVSFDQVVEASDAGNPVE